jgi:hypothetical protein
MVAIAVPVRNLDSGSVLAALAVHAPTARVNLDELLKALPKMKDTAVHLAPLLQRDTVMRKAGPSDHPEPVRVGIKIGPD